jgi:hypothetical protein
MDGYGLGIKRWLARQCCKGVLSDVAMDGTRWMTARDRLLSNKALDGSSTDSLAMDSLAIKRWTAWR